MKSISPPRPSPSASCKARRSNALKVRARGSVQASSEVHPRAPAYEQEPCSICAYDRALNQVGLAPVLSTQNDSEVARTILIALAMDGRSSRVTREGDKAAGREDGMKLAELWWDIARDPMRRDADRLEASQDYRYKSTTHRWRRSAAS